MTTADVVIVGKRVTGGDALKALLRKEHVVIDLVGIAELGDVIRPWTAMPAAASV